MSCASLRCAYAKLCGVCHTWDLTDVDNNTALLARLQHKMDLRNTDRMRLTSLAWAALESHVEVFEWLLLDYGHDDQELSRVNTRTDNTDCRMRNTTQSSTYLPRRRHRWQRHHSRISSCLHQTFPHGHRARLPPN